MYHLGTASKSENGSNVRRGASLDLACILHVVSAEAARYLRARGIANNDSVAARKAAIDAEHAGRQQALSAAQCRNCAGVDHQGAFGFERAGNPLFARRHW